MKGQLIPYYLFVVVTLLLSVGFTTPLIVDSNLYDSTRMGKIFFFTQWIIWFAIASIPVYYMSSSRQIDKLTLAVLAWGIWIFVRGKEGGIWHDEKFFWFSGCFVFYFLATTILKEITTRGWEQLMRIPLLVVALVALAEAALGILQLYGLTPIYHGQFKITGHFFNPAPYAGFLLASLPFSLLLSSVKPNTIINRIIHWVGYLSVCLILVAIPSTRSRAAYLGLAATLLVWISFRYHPLLYIKRVLNSRLKRKLVYVIVPLLSIILLTGLFLFKKDSATGRVLIWKVAVRTIAEKPFIGHGFNTVQATLAPAQADYFLTGNGTENEKMLAGSVRWAFNEFLETASETGLIGLVLLLLVAGYALFYRLPPSLSRQHRLTIGTARASLAGVLVFGCFSYPFYSLSVTLLFFFSLAVLAALQPDRLNKAVRFYNPILKPALQAGIVLLSFFYIRLISPLEHAYWLWNEAEQLYRKGDYVAANNSFGEACHFLQNNGVFLQHYGKSLEMDGRFVDAVSVLSHGRTYYNDEFTGTILGNCYQYIGNYTAAERQYQLAFNMSPKKFYPLYLLAKLYYKVGLVDNAASVATDILSKPIKVPSKAVEEIKAEMKSFVDSVKCIRAIKDNSDCHKWEQTERVPGKSSPILSN